MAKYTYPGIRFTEIDNTIKTEVTTTRGAGAIVMKANRGPVNQRIMTRDYGEFTEYFGEPETITDYGHFAADNFFANSTRLWAVRCTMGDEQYAQIQYSYPDAPVTARMESDTCGVFKYVDNQADYQLKLLQPLSAVPGYLENTSATLAADNWVIADDKYALKHEAGYAEFYDIYSETSDQAVYKTLTTGDITQGIHVAYPSTIRDGEFGKYETKLMVTNDAWESPISAAQVVTTDYNEFKKVTISLNNKQTLNGVATNISFIGTPENVTGWAASGINTLKDVFKSENFAYGDTLLSADWEHQEPLKNFRYGYTTAEKVNIVDWEDSTTPKQYYIDDYMVPNEAYPSEDPTYVSFIGTQQTDYIAGSIEYTEYIMNDKSHAIIGNIQHTSDGYYAKSIMEMYNDENPEPALNGLTPKQVIKDIMDTYSITNITEVSQYTYLRYFQVLPTVEVLERIIKEKPNELNFQNKLFYAVSEQNSKNIQTIPVFSTDNVEAARLPIQSDSYPEGDVVLNNIVAQPTSYLVNSVDKTYANGYTVSTQSEDEAGNGDIENYTSVFDKQFVIASIGPGEYGNDIGISIITPECANIKALEHPNAFNWKDKYDDADLVEADGDDLTWKKVFRINVYVKPKNQTAAGAWGTGMDAMLKMPNETFYVSTDPYAKDENGQSLYAPTVINGISDYIYISRASASKSLDCAGKYQIPTQTFSIYQLTGGKNSTKDNISEKTAALNFYADRQLAKFDILFNVDAIETFSGKQRYNAHQRRIAEIAGNRTMDIGVVQVTSKAAKSCKLMLSEAKMFSFNNPSYVAEYAGYDKYYNSTLASWIYLPKSVAAACSMAYCDTFLYPWYAPAGVARGTISYSTGQLLRLTDVEIGQLYDINVNCSRDCGNYGTVLYGQKTALKKNSLLNRINVRRCLNYIEKELENMMTPYLFAQNSVNTRSSARNDIDSFLQRVKAAEGIEEYSLSVTKDEDDPTILNVNIALVPVSAIEFIDVKITVNRGQVTISEETR